MPYYLAHAGTALNKLAPDGTWEGIALPTGITMSNARRARMAMLNRMVVIVNAPSRNLQFDAETGDAYLLNLVPAPVTTPTLAEGAAGEPSGTYRYVVSFAIRQGSRILTESAWSPIAGPITVADKQIDLSAIETSSVTGVNARRIYRTANNGSEYFLVTTLADNSTTTYTDNTSDYDLALIGSSENRGVPPGADGTDRAVLITAWSDRLWMVGANDPDTVHGSGNREPYVWPANLQYTVNPPGEDATGVTAFMARRDELVIGKRGRIVKMIGDSPDDYALLTIAEGNIGPWSQEAAIVVRDTCYWLAEDGVYEYGPTGLVNLATTDVYPWFTTDEYFNRQLWDQAFMKFNARFNQIELHLAAAGSTVIDRWVSYDLSRRRWLGPHKTGAFTPTAGAALIDSASMNQPVMGGNDGYVWLQNQSTSLDGTHSIAIDWLTPRFTMNTPDIDKYFGELAVIHGDEGTGSVVLTPYPGGSSASAVTAFTVSLNTDRQRLGRVGIGRMVALRFDTLSSGVDFRLYGLELPFHELGRR